MANQINQQSKPDPKGEAVSSLVLGIITITAVAIIFLGFMFEFSKSIVAVLIGRIMVVLWEFWLDTADFFPMGLGVLFPMAFPIAGIVLGVKGLKSTKKNLASVGIMLSLIGLLGWIPICLFFYLMASH